MSMKQPIKIVSYGVRTPVGTSAIKTAANIRAGIDRISIYEDLLDEQYEPVKLGLAEYIHTQHTITERLEKLCLPAIKDALKILESAHSKPDVLPVYIGYPVERPGLDENIQSVLARLIQNTFADFKPVIKFFSYGHAAGAYTIRAAEQYFEEYNNGLCLIGGVDSYLDHQTIKWLERERLMHCTNQKGFIPGESAGFILTGTPDSIEKYGLSSFSEISSYGVSEEPAHILSGQACCGNGFTEAIKGALNGMPEEITVDQIYGTLNGHPWFDNEFGLSFPRILEFLSNPDHLKFPSEHWGDIGAASIPVFITLIAESIRKNYAKGPFSLICSSSMDSSRGAVLIHSLLTT